MAADAAYPRLRRVPAIRGAYKWHEIFFALVGVFHQQVSGFVFRWWKTPTTAVLLSASRMIRIDGLSGFFLGLLNL